MKKIIILILILSGLKLNANPIPLPWIEISEILVNSDSCWQIELKYEYAEQDMPIDSIEISSSLGKSAVKHFLIEGESGYLVISGDSLYSNVKINPSGDSITMTYWIGPNHEAYSYSDILIFGDYFSSVIGKPKNGHSIVKLDYNIYSKDKSPSIGSENDTTGMMGTLKGYIFDKNNQLVTNKTLMLDFEFSTDQDGDYSTRLYSNHYVSNTIKYKAQESYHSSGIQTAIDLVMEPDSVIDLNIYLTDTLLTDINNQKQTQNSLIKLYPNPLKNSQLINYAIDLPVRSSDAVIEIVTLEGKLIHSKKIKENKGIIKLPENITSGLYFFNLVLNNSVQYTTRFIITLQ